MIYLLKYMIVEVTIQLPNQFLCGYFHILNANITNSNNNQQIHMKFSIPISV